MTSTDPVCAFHGLPWSEHDGGVGARSLETAQAELGE
jgi:hypothetical protein